MQYKKRYKTYYTHNKAYFNSGFNKGYSYGTSNNSNLNFYKLLNYSISTTDEKSLSLSESLEKYKHLIVLVYQKNEYYRDNVVTLNNFISDSSAVSVASRCSLSKDDFISKNTIETYTYSGTGQTRITISYIDNSTLSIKPNVTNRIVEIWGIK